MDYNELIKDFNRTRSYMRGFYVYGFRSRDEFTEKSPRTYDNERRRIESWLGEYMQFRKNSEGKNLFLSIDSREIAHNPLYKAWKAKSFTDKVISLHFIIFDLLSDPEVRMTSREVTEQVWSYMAGFPDPAEVDESTVRKKLNEYVAEGLLLTEKTGRQVYYRRAPECPLPDPDILNFFSEVLPCGVVGSFLLDKEENPSSLFSFKHHYITGAMDSEILCTLFMAIREKRSVEIRTQNKQPGEKRTDVVPLKIMLSAQNGRQHLMVYNIRRKRILSYRLDYIISAEIKEPFEHYDEVQNTLRNMLPHIWGVSTQSDFGLRMEHVDFTIRYADNEQFIRSRLEREKRCGTVEHPDNNTSRFSADVYDSSEIVPWIRTFLCRITEIHFSNEDLDKQFKDDLRLMYEQYGLGGDEK